MLPGSSIQFLLFLMNKSKNKQEKGWLRNAVGLCHCEVFETDTLYEVAKLCDRHGTVESVNVNNCMACHITHMACHISHQGATILSNQFKTTKSKFPVGKSIESVIFIALMFSLCKPPSLFTRSFPNLPEDEPKLSRMHLGYIRPHLHTTNGSNLLRGCLETIGSNKMETFKTESSCSRRRCYWWIKKDFGSHNWK